MSFGELLKTIRVRSGMTLRQFADALQVSPVYISDVERDNRQPLTTDKILRLALINGISQQDIDDLMVAATTQRGAVQLTVPENTDAQIALSGMARGGFSDEQWKELRFLVERLRRES